MITIIVKETVTVNGQTVTKEVTLSADFPSDSQNEEKAKELLAELNKTTDSLKQANERNKI